jgi:hypothetical protein
LKKGSPPFSKLRDESVQGCHTPGKLLHVFDASGSFHLGDGGDLLGVGFDATMAIMKSSSFPEGTPKTLVRVELPLVLPQRCEGLFKIGDEHVRVSGLDDNVIHISLDILIELFLETLLYSSLTGSTGVLQPERHCRVAVSAKRGDKHGLLPVFFLDSNLVVPRVAVEEAE